MDPASSYLGKLLLEDVTPVIMVLSTPLVEEACQKNGLSFIEMLRPFCDFDNIDVPVRTSSDQPYRLQTFKLRVFYASDIHPQNHEVAANRLKEVVASASGSILTELESDPPQLDKITSLSESDIQPSWLQKINRDLAGAVSFSDHEAFDHPVACLLAVSSKDENPMNKFVDFFNTNQIPSVLNDSMDPKILKYYLLLHDRQDGPTEKANGILSEIRCTFGMSDCRLLCINSGMDENTEWREYPWFKYKTDCSPMDNITFFLGIDDLNEIKAFMQDLSSKKLIPHMEQKIRLLNQQVSATRRGFRNQIKNLWWRKGKEDAPDAPTGSTYTFSSIESQIRVLGDYAFMLRDYELALSNYRLLSTDYKLDKAWKRYAGVQEMMGLALFMLDQSRKDSEYCMETAFQTYVRLGPSALRNATRCGVWWAEMLKARGQYKEAADVYFRISIEDPSLHAAVMLEQSSYCYLFANPPMFRKFGFHLVLAGNRYYISDQREHALRTYRFALSVYRGNAWSYINDHVNYNIGRWYAFLGMFDSATKHMLEVLECSHQSVATQDLFLKEFQHIVQKMGRKLTVPKLQLPFVNMSSIKVIFEDHRTYASPAAANVRENIWQILEENMVPSTTTKTNWLQPRKSSSKKSGDDYISILGEAIRVYVTMKNPLRISIPVSGVSLFCEYSARPVKAESEDTGTLNGGSNYTYGEPLSSRKEDDMEYFELSQIDFVLGGGETRKVQLEVIPKVEGFLKIVGVRWVLSGFVHSYRYFETDVKSNNRKGRKYMISTRTNMSFVVIKGLPKLEGSIADLPRKTFSGDLRPLTLKLENRSEYSIKNLKMMISHPRFLIPGTAGNLCSEFPNCLHKNVHLEGSDDQSDLGKKIDGLPFLFPSDVTIQGGKVLEWPFWLHSAISGNISLYISIYYEIEGSFEMNHRTLRMYYELEVSPSLDISIVVTPCADSLQEFIVRFEIASKMIAESLWLRQLSSIGSRWTLSALPSFDYDGNKLLVAGQALSCFFKLKESSTKDGTVSDMLLGSPEESEPLLDISTRPITDFHYHEKVHQGIALQDHTMDFVLISQLIRDGTNSENSERDQVQLLSHHVCGSSILSRNPVWSLMSGPQEIRHDFTAPFCITSFDLTVYNYSEHAAFVKVSTFEVSDVPSESTADLLKYKSGWHDISLDTDTGSSGINHSTASSNVTSPFLWCGSSSRTLQLQPMSLAKVPLTVCVFSPGIYNLSAYEVRWNLHISNSEGSSDMKWQSSGVNKGRPHYFTVLQSLQK